MCELRTLPKGRPLSFGVEVALLRACVRLARVSPYMGERQAAKLPDGALEFALLSPAERASRSEEYSETVRELVRAMEEKR